LKIYTYMYILNTNITYAIRDTVIMLETYIYILIFIFMDAFEYYDNEDIYNTNNI